MKSRLLLVLFLLLFHSELRAESEAEKAGMSPKLIIYAAKGAANSCGPGCDRWIAVEGQVDEGAASRVSRFLRDVKDTQRPIYFHSPGGSVGQSFQIGRLLRSRKAVARVGRTIVAACGDSKPADPACLKIKTGGGELQAEISTHNSMCNSACGYLFLGATTREVAPDAAMAVHNSKLTLIVHGHPPPQIVAEFRERGIARADRERSAFVASMGISHELDDLIKTVKFESLHILTRDELYRFGVDKRSLPETAWTMENEKRPFLRKIAFARQGDGAAFRRMEWHLSCENKDRARLMFARESEPGSTTKSTAMMMAGTEKVVAFGKFPTRVGKYDVWSDTLGPDAVKAMVAAPRLQVGEGVLGPDGKINMTTFDMDNNGLDASWTQLSASCPTAPITTRSPAVAPNVSAAPEH